MNIPINHRWIARGAALWLGGACAAVGFSAPRVQKPAPVTAAKPADAVATFLKLFEALDTDRDGVVPLAHLFDALNLQQAEARQVKRARALDGNGDGKVTRAEAIASVHAEITYQTNRGMNTDADGDDTLTPLEYSLSYADPNGKADASGLTPAQQRGFQQDDLNGDGKVTRAEIETRVVRSYASSYWAQAMAVRARRADRNGDGLIDESEFAGLEGAPLTPDAQERFRAAGAKDGQLAVQNTMFLFIRLNETQRAAAEKRLEEFESQLKAGQTSKLSEGVKP
jgi:Ca2+-binding EF-hand superfamily protein